MTKKERLALVRQFLKQLDEIDLRGKPRDEAGWIALKLSVSLEDAVKLIAKAKAEVPHA